MQVIHCRTVVILDRPMDLVVTSRHYCKDGFLKLTVLPLSTKHIYVVVLLPDFACHGLQLHKANLFDKMDASTSSRKELLKLACSKLKT